MQDGGPLCWIVELLSLAGLAGLSSAGLPRGMDPMTVSSARLLLCSTALLCVAGPPIRATSQPVASPQAMTTSSTRDPVTVRGCLDGRWLRILDRDATDLSGVQRVRLKGARAMLRLLGERRGDYVEVTGDLDLGARDRLDARRKVKVGGKTTVSIGASAEQVSGGTADVAPDPTLVVDAFTRLGEDCPRH